MRYEIDKMAGNVDIMKDVAWYCRLYKAYPPRPLQFAKVLPYSVIYIVRANYHEGCYHKETDLRQDIGTCLI
jgi:hypothetical protein